jgi:hypothetical protein
LGEGENLTIVASCFWLATFLILPMMTIGRAANHEEGEGYREKVWSRGWSADVVKTGGESARTPYDVSKVWSVRKSERELGAG